jgi:DNA-binding transcriptional regulator YbjK
MTDIRPAAYRRSAGSPRGRARKEALLSAVVDDLAVNGLAGFSLRQAARAAGTTHKVLLYYFDGPEDLLGQALPKLRERRTTAVQQAAAPAVSLASRVSAIWPVLMEDSTGLRVIDQATGLAMYDPVRYAHLARGGFESYIEPLQAWCPPQWTAEHKREISIFILTTLRGCLVEWRTTGDMANITPVLDALVRALEREEKAG